MICVRAPKGNPAETGGVGLKIVSAGRDWSPAKKVHSHKIPANFL
jgi:hypothetical protein